MANALDFIIRLRDMLTPGMRNAAQVSNSTANQIQNGMNRANASSRQFGASLRELKDRLEAVNRTRSTTRLESEFRAATAEAKRLEAEIRRINNIGESSGGGILGSLKSKIAGYVTAGAAIAFAVSSVQAAMDFQVKNKTYEVLAGSATRGQALSAQLLDLKQNTIMGTSVYQNAQTLMGFGVGDREVIRDLKQIGDIALGDVDRMSRLTLAYAQTRAAGKLMGQDLLQYVNAGFNPLGVIAENWQKFGLKHAVTVGQLKEMMTKGQISAAAIAKAFEVATSSGGRFHNMMNTIAGTTAGKLQLMKGHFAAFQIQVGQRLMPLTNQLLDFGSAMLKAISHGKSAADQVNDQIVKIRGLQLEITNANTSQERRLELMKQLTDINPNLTKGINAEAIEYGKLADNINRAVAALNQKKIASNIEIENASKVYQFNKAQNANASANADIVSLLVKVDPKLAERTDMTYGQKQVVAAAILKERIKNGQVTKATVSSATVGGASSTRFTSEEQLMLESLQIQISRSNQALNTIKTLSPGISKMHKDIQTATDAYNKLFDLTPKIEPTKNGKKGSKGDTSATGGGTGVGSDDGSFLLEGKASKISQGGQRNITINIGKQIEHLELHVMSNQEAGREMESIIRESMLRVLHSLNGETDGRI